MQILHVYVTRAYTVFNIQGSLEPGTVLTKSDSGTLTLEDVLGQNLDKPGRSERGIGISADVEVELPYEPGMKAKRYM